MVEEAKKALKLSIPVRLKSRNISWYFHDLDCILQHDIWLSSLAYVVWINLAHGPPAFTGEIRAQIFQLEEVLIYS